MPEPNTPGVVDDLHIVSVDIDVQVVESSIENEAMRVIKEQAQLGLEGDELAQAVRNALADLPTRPIDEASRGATAEAFNLGRNLAAQDVEEQIQAVVRTEVLDLDTCRRRDPGEEDRCFELDGETYLFNTPAYFEFMPPAKCRGRVKCRGFYIYLTEDPA